MNWFTDCKRFSCNHWGTFQGSLRWNRNRLQSQTRDGRNARLGLCSNTGVRLIAGSNCSGWFLRLACCWLQPWESRFYATRDVPQPAIVDAAALESSIHGGISCADVRRHAPAYVAGTLAPELSAQIDQHLRECPPCVRYFQRHFPEHRLPVARNRDRVFELLGVVR